MQLICNVFTFLSPVSDNQQDHSKTNINNKKQENQKGKNTNIHCKTPKQKRKETQKQENNI